MSVAVDLQSSQSGIRAAQVELSAGSETNSQQRSTIETLLCSELDLDDSAIYWAGQAEGG